MSKKIGIIGSGIVGQTLANGFVTDGYDVMIGTNTAAKREELKARTNGKAQVGSFEDAARFGEAVVLATKNPIADAPPVNGVMQYFTSQNDSLMERLQKLAPEARFVKSFSCIGNAFMVNPDFNGVKPTMFICGNHEGAKSEVKTRMTRACLAEARRRSGERRLVRRSP